MNVGQVEGRRVHDGRAVEGQTLVVAWAGDDRLVVLAKAGRRLAAATTLDELYPLATELAIDILDASSASLARVESDRGILRVLRNAGQLAPWEEPEPVDETYEIADFPLLAATADDARPWVGDLGDPATGDDHRELLQRMGMATSISLPLIVHGTVWGEVGAARRSGMPSFGQNDIAAGEAFCGLLSAALTRIAERDQLLDLAYRDALTGLGNRRAIDDRLEDLLEAIAGTSRTVAVVLADVNGLKRVNDTHGHDAGDRVLREVGVILSRVASTVAGCRAARHGGDEFCLLIEDISEIDLQRLTDRLSEDAATLPMGAGLSCGWARATARSLDGVTPREAARSLLRLADAAQYRAKRSGREVLAGTSLGDRQVTAAQTGVRIVTDALGRLGRCGRAIDERFEAVARSVADLVDAAGWCISVSVDGGPLVIVHNADTRRVGSEMTTFEPGTTYDLDDYPATSAALRGGTFHATLDSGHETERAFLAAHGYDEIIGAGTPFGRYSWLVEVLGDAMSAELAPHRGVLRALVALSAADGADATPPGWVVDHSDVGSTAC